MSEQVVWRRARIEDQKGLLIGPVGFGRWIVGKVTALPEVVPAQLAARPLALSRPSQAGAAPAPDIPRTKISPHHLEVLQTQIEQVLTETENSRYYVRYLAQSPLLDHYLREVGLLPEIDLPRVNG